MSAHITTLSNDELPKDLTPMATLKGAKMFIPFTEASATKPEAIVANPMPHVAMRKVSASRCDGYFRLWCSVTIQDSNAVARSVAPAPDHKYARSGGHPEKYSKRGKLRKEAKESQERYCTTKIERYRTYDKRDSQDKRNTCIRYRREERDHWAQRGERTTAEALS